MRRERLDIYREVVKALKEGPKNIHQISDQNDINWETVRKALETLEAAGFVHKEEKRYVLDGPVLDNDTLLGLPLEEEKKKQLCEIANRVQKLSHFSKTFLQKAVIEVIKKHNLPLPYGWYLYGPCTILRLNPETLQRYGETKRYDATIKDIIQRYKRFDTTDQLMEDIYTQEKNETYLSRLRIHNLFKEPFTEQALVQLDLNLKSFLMHIDTDEARLIEIFYSTYTRLRKLPLEQVENLRLEVFSAYKTLWEILASYSLYSTSKEYFAGNTKPNYLLRKNTLVEPFEEYIEILQEHCPLMKPLSPALQRVRDSLGER
jgi:predicted transcriptional regulator